MSVPRKILRLQRSQEERIPGFDTVAAHRQELDAADRGYLPPQASCSAGQDDSWAGSKAPRHRSVLPGDERRGVAHCSTNLALLFAVGVAIGFAKKADGSNALAAVRRLPGHCSRSSDLVARRAGWPARQQGRAGDDRLQGAGGHRRRAGDRVAVRSLSHPSNCLHTSASSEGGRFVPIVVSLASLFLAFRDELLLSGL